MGIAIHILNGMVYNFMKELSVKAIIGCQRIGIEGSTRLDVTFYQSLKCPLLSVGYHRCRHRTTALQEPHSRRLVFSAGPTDCGIPLFLVHVPSFATNERLINFDFSIELHEGSRLHSLANSMEHEPCRLLSNTKRPMQFVRTDSVLTVGQHPHGRKPLLQRKRRVLKDCPDLERELRARMASIA